MACIVLACLQESVSFEDIMSQMQDMINPQVRSFFLATLLCRIKHTRGGVGYTLQGERGAGHDQPAGASLIHPVLRAGCGGYATGSRQLQVALICAQARALGESAGRGGQGWLPAASLPGNDFCFQAEHCSQLNPYPLLGPALLPSCANILPNPPHPHRCRTHASSRCTTSSAPASWPAPSSTSCSTCPSSWRTKRATRLFRAR